MKPLFKEILNYQGNKYWVNIFNSSDYSKLKKITQVYGFVFDKKQRILVIRLKGRDAWCLPGGGPEDYDKNWKETLKREVLEEADVKIQNIRPCFYLTSKEKKIFSFKNPEKVLLRTIAQVKKIKPQTIDPATGSFNERKFIDSKDFLKYCPWGENGRVQLELALKTFNKKI